MAEIEKAIVEETETPQTEEIDVEVESENTGTTTVEETVNETEAFFSNLALDMSDEVLQRMSNQLLDDFKKDRITTVISKILNNTTDGPEFISDLLNKYDLNLQQFTSLYVAEVSNVGLFNAILLIIGILGDNVLFNTTPPIFITNSEVCLALV